MTITVIFRELGAPVTVLRWRPNEFSNGVRCAALSGDLLHLVYESKRHNGALNLSSRLCWSLGAEGGRRAAGPARGRARRLA
jgi:hypothetical protein